MNNAKHEGSQCNSPHLLYCLSSMYVVQWVHDYSDLHFAIGTPTLSEILKLRMEEMGLSVAKLAKILGVTPLNIKAYLSGSEEPTLSVGREISRRLGVDANLVLGLS